METNGKMIEVKNLSFAYGSHQILSELTFSIPAGGVTTIMGANGCGKSTLFSLMTKNLSPQKGKILFDGKDIAAMRISEFAKKVSIVHQYNTAAEDITVEQLVGYGRTPYQKMLGNRSDEDEKLIQWAIEVTGIGEFNQAISFSDEVIGLKSGKVAMIGKPQEVITTENIENLYGVHLPVIELDGQKVVLTA